MGVPTDGRGPCKICGPADEYHPACCSGSVKIIKVRNSSCSAVRSYVLTMCAQLFLSAAAGMRIVK